MVIIEVHAISSLEKLFAKSELILSINPSRTLIPSIKKSKISSTRTTTKRVTKSISPSKRAKGKRSSSSTKKCVVKKRF